MTTTEPAETLIAALLTLSRFLKSLPEDPPSNREAVGQMNQALVLYDLVFDELYRAGASEIADAWRSGLVDNIETGMNRVPGEIPIGEYRALVAASLWRNGYRLPDAGEKDSPMQAAMDATDLFIRTIEQVEDTTNDAAWRDAFEQNYRDKIFGNPADGSERVRRSITRFKKGIKDEPLVRFDPSRMRFELVPFEESTHGLPAKKGRPRTNQH